MTYIRDDLAKAVATEVWGVTFLKYLSAISEKILISVGKIDKLMAVVKLEITNFSRQFQKINLED